MRDKNDIFEKKMFFRQLGPALISALSLAIADMADSLVLGQSMGAPGLAAIALSLPIFMVYNVLMHGLGLGGSIRYAKEMGVHDPEKARAGFKGVLFSGVLIATAIAIFGNIFCKQILWLLGTTPADTEVYPLAALYLRMFLLGAPIFFAGYILNYYLRNDDLEKEAAAGFTIANISDLVLNFWFVLILKKGVMGAATATICGYTILLIFYVLVLIVSKSNLSLAGPKADFSVAFGCFKTGFSNSVQYLCTMIFVIIVNQALMKTVGLVGVAIFDVTQSISYLFVYAYRAVAQASQPIVSTYESECNYEGQKKVLRMGILTAAAYGTICAVLLMVFAVPICMLFGIQEDASIEVGRIAITLYAISAMVSAFLVMIENYFEAKEELKPAYTISLLHGAVLMIPIAVVCAMLGGKMIWLMYPLAEVISIIVAGVLWKTGKIRSVRISTDRIADFMIADEKCEISEVTQQVEAFLEKWDANPKQSTYVQMTIEEIVVAFIESGFTDADCYAHITVVVEENADVRLHIRYTSPTFNPFALQTGLLTEENADEMIGTVGLLLVKKKSKSFSYRSFQGFGTLCVVI